MDNQNFLKMKIEELTKNNSSVKEEIELLKNLSYLKAEKRELNRERRKLKVKRLLRF